MISLITILCFTIAVGKNASADGSVLLGHNEDDRNVTEYYVNRTRQGLWIQVPGLKAADSFVNKWGVSIVSDNCKSREDTEDYTDGGILYDLRFTVYQQARSAAEAVMIIGKLVETRGYSDSGRSYIVADSKEAWVVSIARGRHWVAQRVPDDAVMSIPNYYVIGEVDLDDKDNFLSCPDLVGYAVKRGWYDPEKDGEFSFRNVYASPSTLISPHNLKRHKAVNEALGLVYDSEHVPFAVRPHKKLDADDLKNILSDPEGACSETTIYSTVFKFSKNRKELWLCPEKPDQGEYAIFSLKGKDERKSCKVKNVILTIQPNRPEDVPSDRPLRKLKKSI